MFYDIYVRLCKEKGVSPSRAAEENGINKSNVSNWKNNGYTPRGEALEQLADYFEVSVDYLLGKSDSKALTTQKTLPSDVDIKFALFHGEEGVTDEMYNEVMRYAQYLIEKEKQQEK